MPPYRPRVIDSELDAFLPHLAAVALEGPKAIGKTATAERRVQVVVRLDEPAERAIAAADVRRLVRGVPPTLFDEWQHLPTIWDAIRREVDAGAPAGSFLLAGSAAPADAPVHSGAGRILQLRMRPLALSERGISEPTVSLAALLTGVRPDIDGTSSLTLAGYVEEILASGFPGIRDLPARVRSAQIDAYVARVVDRDFQEQGHKVRRPDALRRWMAAYAAATATTTALEKIRNAATSGDGQVPSRPITIAYRDILHQLFLLDPVPGWLPTRNPVRQLTESPKHHLADPALAARLLGLNARSLLRGEGPAAGLRHGTFLGQLFDSLVTLSVRVYAQAAEARISHLRMAGGDHEVDLIVEAADQRVLAIEIKLSGHVTDADVKHLRWLSDRLGDDLLDAMIITTGERAYRRADGIAVVPAALVGP